MTAHDQHEGQVLISGLGPVTCLGLGADEFAEQIGVLSSHAAPDHGVLFNEGLVPDFDLQHFVEARRPYLDPQSRCALAAAALAVASARLQMEDLDPARRGLSFGTALGNLQTQAAFQGLVDRKGMRLGSPVLFSHAYPNTTASILAIEFGLRGAHQNFCGDMLCGAQALEAGLLALRAGRADLVLAGGADVVDVDLMQRLGDGSAGDGLIPGQGAGLLLLESDDAVKRREGTVFCELSSVVCKGIGPRRSGQALGKALRGAAAEAAEEAGIWAGDIGAVLLAGAALFDTRVTEAEQSALEEHSVVPRLRLARFVGETFAAGFPLACIAAAAMLNAGVALTAASFARKAGGVEFWVERGPEPLMGDSALVLGCTPYLAAAAVLRAI